MTKLISVWSPKGGVGKTTITLHLADCLARDKKRVLVFDADDQKSLTEVFRAADPGSFEFDVTPEIPKSITGYDYVIVDFPPTVKALTKDLQAILDKSDHVVSPVRASRLDLMSFKAVTKAIPSERLISVLSAFDQRIKDQAEVKQQIASGFTVLSYSSVYSRTVNMCKTVFSDTVQTLYGVKKAANEMKKLAERIK